MNKEKYIENFQLFTEINEIYCITRSSSRQSRSKQIDFPTIYSSGTKVRVAI